MEKSTLANDMSRNVDGDEYFSVSLSLSSSINAEIQTNGVSVLFTISLLLPAWGSFRHLPGFPECSD